MTLKKVLLSIVLLITTLICFVLFSNVLINTIYIGFIVPLLLQKVWFNVWWFRCRDDNSLYVDIFFTLVFISISLWFFDIITLQSFHHPKYDWFPSDTSQPFEYTWLRVLSLIPNKLFFLFAMVYLWNRRFIKKQNKYLNGLFLCIRAYYTLIFSLPFLFLIAIKLYLLVK